MLASGYLIIHFIVIMLYILEGLYTFCEVFVNTYRVIQHLFALHFSDYELFIYVVQFVLSHLLVSVHLFIQIDKGFHSIMYLLSQQISKMECYRRKYGTCGIFHKSSF